MGEWGCVWGDGGVRGDIGMRRVVDVDVAM